MLSSTPEKKGRTARVEGEADEDADEVVDDCPPPRISFAVSTSFRSSSGAHLRSRVLRQEPGQHPAHSSRGRKSDSPLSLSLIKYPKYLSYYRTSPRSASSPKQLEQGRRRTHDDLDGGVPEAQDVREHDDGEACRGGVDRLGHARVS